MNKSFDMVILTKSSKFHENCVAGVDCETGELVRLVTDNAEKHGALSYEDLIMDNGAPAMPLYIVHVQNAEKVHGDIQTENYRIDRSKRLQFIKRITVEEMISNYISPSREREVFSGIWPKMYYADAQKVGHSLEVLLVTNLTLNTQLNIYGKPKTKADFLMNGVHFRDFSVTDRSYYGQDGDVRYVGKACIVCSIADDQKAKEIGYYKFISAIYELH